MHAERQDLVLGDRHEVRLLHPRGDARVSVRRRTARHLDKVLLAVAAVRPVLRFERAELRTRAGLQTHVVRCAQTSPSVTYKVFRAATEALGLVGHGRFAHFMLPDTWVLGGTDSDCKERDREKTDAKVEV